MTDNTERLAFLGAERHRLEDATARHDDGWRGKSGQFLGVDYGADAAIMRRWWDRSLFDLDEIAIEVTGAAMGFTERADVDLSKPAPDEGRLVDPSARDQYRQLYGQHQATVEKIAVLRATIADEIATIEGNG